MLEKIVVNLSREPALYAYAFGRFYKFRPSLSGFVGADYPFSLSTTRLCSVIFDHEGNVHESKSLCDIKVVNQILSNLSINEINENLIKDFSELDRSSINTIFKLASGIVSDNNSYERLKEQLRNNGSNS